MIFFQKYILTTRFQYYFTVSNHFTGELTEEDFKNGIDIDIDNEVPDGKDTIDDAVEKGDGNFQGDIILTEEQMKIINGETRLKAFQVLAKKWPKYGNVVRIPYTITSGFSPNERAHISRAMTEYRRKTCIRLEILTQSTIFNIQYIFHLMSS